MNCPFHVLVYKSQVRSYRDLPMRLSELGTIYRHERLGALHGLLRIRGGTQDDSHIICTPDQLIDEILKVFELTFEIHATFGFGDPIVNLSTLPGQTILDETMAARATEALGDGPRQERAALHRGAGRGNVLRPEGRLPLQGRDRPAVAAHHRAVRLRAARAVRHGVHRRGQRAPPPGHDPPRDPRHARAVQRRADRALRRRVPAVAVSRAHPVRARRRPPRRVLRRAGVPRDGQRGSGRSSTTRRRPSARRSARPS